MRSGLMILAFLGLCSFEASVKLVRTKVSADISVMLPRNFRVMDDLDFGQRYPSVRKPIAAYTNEDRLVDFSVNISATQWPDQNVELARKFFKAGLANLFDNVEFLSEGIQEIHGKQFIFFEFESRIKGNPIELSQRDPVLSYTYIQYLVEPGRTLVFSFNCPRRVRLEWQETAGKMMKSIKLK